MGRPNKIFAIRVVSITVIVGAIAAMLLTLRRERPALHASAASSAVAHESHKAAARSADAPVTVINLPMPEQSAQASEADDGDFGPVRIPEFDARLSLYPAILAAQQLAALRSAFSAVGSPGFPMPAAGFGAGAAMGGAAGSSPSLNYSGLELGLLGDGASDSDQMSTRKGLGHFGWVLIAGGQGGGKLALERAELFDPVQMNFVATGAMHWPRAHFVAADLEAGKTLVAGGDDAQGKPIASAELYDPVAGKFSATGAMSVARAGHTATPISGCNCAADGKILVAGGASTAGAAPLASAELYDPVAGTFAPTGAMNQARAWQTASLLGSGPLAGQVLIAGGIGSRATPLASAEIYDPRTGAFTETAPMSTGRADQTATWLNPAVVSGEFAGKVLVAGGWTGDQVSDTAEVFDPAGQSFIPAGTMNEARMYQAAVLMPNGKVLIAGGEKAPEKALASAEIYDPVKEAFSASAPMLSVHIGGVASILPGAKVLIAGGRSGNAEVYNPATGSFRLTAAMPVDVAYAAGAAIAP
ncbi:MAG TPA: kelch repeat-containing protein [Candidatus Binataceae bacterium]|nr:kelch repeat-containing protein [Candidatus Binataceae bacterium]